LLHITAAKALWTLQRRDQARRAATAALAAAPSDALKHDVLTELQEMLESGRQKSGEEE
jgi:hypothetical protein